MSVVEQKRQRDKLRLDAWRENNPEKYRAQGRRYRARHPDKGGRLWRTKNRAHFLIIKARCEARRHGRSFEVPTPDLLAMIAPMICAVTGRKLSFEWNGEGTNPWAPSIDRIDSSRGYVNGNVQIVCWAYNRAKAEWSEDIVREWAELLIARRK